MLTTLGVAVLIGSVGTLIVAFANAYLAARAELRHQDRVARHR